MEASLKERARATMTPARAAMEKRNQNHLTVVTTDTEPMYKLMIHTAGKAKDRDCREIRPAAPV
jgi:hypothetical protein